MKLEGLKDKFVIFGEFGVFMGRENLWYGRRREKARNSGLECVGLDILVRKLNAVYNVGLFMSWCKQL